MVLYNVETEKGVCVCYEQNSVYYPVREEDNEKFFAEHIISVDRIKNE